jgi:hypothetical protein
VIKIAPQTIEFIALKNLIKIAQVKLTVEI